MKAQFKYSFIAGLSARLPVFAVCLLLYLTFGILGSFDLLPNAALITATSLGGIAITVMLAVNIIGDVAIAKRMFSAPDAYLHALTPAPRRNILFTSLIAMMVMDIISMTVVITGEVWLSLNLSHVDMWRIMRGIDNPLPAIWHALLIVFGYLLIMMIILFSVAAGKSVFYKKAASGFLAFLLACGCYYVVDLLALILTPLSTVSRYGIIIVLTLNNTGMPLFILLIALEAFGFFVLTEKLLERKINI